jgi:Domain of unknown function (DUF4406)
LKLYLAGKMSGVEQFNFPAFHAEAARLRSLGYEVVNPAELNEGNEGNWQACMKVDIHELIECDGVALMDGWETSEGASLERDISFRLGLALYRSKSLRLPIEPPRPVAGAASTSDGGIKFWLVWSPSGTKPPKYRHRSIGEAATEAERLAAVNPCSEFIVLGAETSRRMESMKRTDFDAEIPF